MSVKTFAQYRLHCDTPHCGSASGVNHDLEALRATSRDQGWESAGEAHRCARCVRKGLFPDQWPVPPVQTAEKGQA